MTVPTLILAIVSLLVAGTPADAQISGATVTASGSTGNESGADFYRQATPTIVTNNGPEVKTRFAWNLSADVPQGAGARSEPGTASHNVMFTVTAPGAYFLTITTSRLGDLNR